MSKTKYRGAQCAPMASRIDIQALCDAGANMIRYQMITFLRCTGEEWKNLIRGYLDHFDSQIAPIITNQKIILDIHWPPGVGMSTLFTNQEDMDTLIQMWDEISLRYKFDNKVYAYGILNEPAGTSPQVAKLMQTAQATIRKNDKRKMIIITTKVSSFLDFRSMKKSEFKNVYYEAHFYKPIAFVGQGIDGVPIGPKYPTKGSNKEKMIQWLKPMRDFQLKNNTLMYMGEFAASAFADYDSRLNYYRDLISVFESYGWNWTLHAWREASCWDIECHEGLFNYIKSMWSKNR